MKETGRRALSGTGESSSGRRLLRLEEAADYLQLAASAIYKMTCPTAKLRIPHIRIGGRIRFRQEELDRWISLNRVSNIEVLEKIRAEPGGCRG